MRIVDTLALHVVPAKRLVRLFLANALAQMFLQCFLKMSVGSNVTPRYVE